MPGDPIVHQSHQHDYLNILEYRVGQCSTNQWQDVIEKDLDQSVYQSTFIAGCVSQVQQSESDDQSLEQANNAMRLLRAIHALMVDPELSIVASKWLFLSNNQQSDDQLPSFVGWLLQSINLECSFDLLTELFSVLILCCQSINQSNQQIINESIKSLPNDLLQDACFSCVIVSHSANTSLSDLAATVLLILERFNNINLSIRQLDDDSKSLMLSMIQPASIHLILYEAAQESDQSISLRDQPIDEYARSNVLTPVINQSIHCLNTGTVNTSINQLINPCYDPSNHHSINDFFVTAPLNLIHGILSTNQFSLIYSNDLLVLADILAQLIEDRAGDNMTNGHLNNESVSEDVCSIALNCLIRLIDGWPDLKQRSASKRERFARAARASISQSDEQSLTGEQSNKNDRHNVARRLSQLIEQWTTEA